MIITTIINADKGIAYRQNVVTGELWTIQFCPVSGRVIAAS
jgi:hypothetical protein